MITKVNEERRNEGRRIEKDNLIPKTRQKREVIVVKHLAVFGPLNTLYQQRNNEREKTVGANVGPDVVHARRRCHAVCSQGTCDRDRDRGSPQPVG